MCLMFTAIDSHPKYRLVIAANRDEFYDRPTAPAAFWPEAPELLAGRDLRAGGTWLGITRKGQIAALTNYRDPKLTKTNAPSRGKLVTAFLLGRESPVSYLERLSGDAHLYSGFNILVGHKREFYSYASCLKEIRKLSPGIHGLSNHLMDTPWPKVEKGKEALGRILTREDFSTKELFQLLLNRTIPGDESLPDTGVGLEWERILSPIFITSSTYGTRSSTVILIDHKGKVTFIEKSYDSSIDAPATVKHMFLLED